MQYYPIFLNIKDKKCLVIGAGSVGMRKVETLVQCGAKRVVLLDIAPIDKNFLKKIDKEIVIFEQRAFTESDLENTFLVFLASNNREENKKITAICKKNKILCNAADALKESDFILPGLINKGSIQIAIGTQGKSPAFSKYLKNEIESVILDEYEEIIEILARLRPLLLKQALKKGKNAEIFSGIMTKDILDIIKEKNYCLLKEKLIELLPKELHGNLEEIIYG